MVISMKQELNIYEENMTNYVKVVISGEVDIYTSTKLKEKLYDIIDKNDKDLKIDCSQLKYIDSTGLGIFAGAFKKAKEFDRKIYLTGLKSNIKKLFVITGLDKLFIIEE